MTGIGPNPPHNNEASKNIRAQNNSSAKNPQVSAIDAFFGEYSSDVNPSSSAAVLKTHDDIDLVDAKYIGPDGINHIRQTSDLIWKQQGMKTCPKQNLPEYKTVLSQMPQDHNLDQVYRSDPDKHWDETKPVVVLFADEHFTQSVSIDNATYLHKLLIQFNFDLLPVEERFADIMPVSRLETNSGSTENIASQYGPIVATEHLAKLSGKTVQRVATETVELGLETFIDDIFLAFTQLNYAFHQKDDNGMNIYRNQLMGLLNGFCASSILLRLEPENTNMAKVFALHMEKLKKQFGIQEVNLLERHVGIQGGPKLDYFGIDLINSPAFAGITSGSQEPNKKMEAIYK
ncbi:MAG: hypothetical protein LW817_00240 [Candidatus Caenarcaniphilales bacterium]|jgi:hypothetical protein|nr:hypothetical protein [Candidatus Caenarcaniphilales bacterium]